MRFRYLNRDRPYIVRHMGRHLRERFGGEVCGWLARAGDLEAGNYRLGGWAAQGYLANVAGGVVSNELAVIYAEEMAQRNK